MMSGSRREPRRDLFDTPNKERTNEIAAVAATQVQKSPTFSGLLRMDVAGSPGGAARVPSDFRMSPFAESATRPRRTDVTASTGAYGVSFVSDAGDLPLNEPRLAPLGDEGWAVPPSFDEGGSVVNVRGADWERRLRSRERALAQSEAELRRAVASADAERARSEAALEQREAAAAEAIAMASEKQAAATVAAAAEARANAALAELKQRVDNEREELQAGVKRRESVVETKERELARDAEETKARAEREAAETRATALAELRATKRLVGDSQRELDRLTNERADAEAGIDRARAEIATTRDAAEGEADLLGAETVRVRESTRIARDALDALEKERDATRFAIENELSEMRDARERHAHAMASERAAADAAHAVSATEIDEKLHRLRDMAAAYAEQTRVMDAKIAAHALEVERANTAARVATHRAESAEADASVSRAEASELGAQARAVLEDCSAERSQNATERAAVEDLRRDVENFRERARVESGKILQGREGVLREWETKMEADEQESRRKRREGEDSLRRWAVEVKRKEDALVLETAKQIEALKLEREEILVGKQKNTETREKMSEEVRKEKTRAMKEVEVKTDLWKVSAEDERKKMEDERSANAKTLRAKHEKLERVEKELHKEYDTKNARFAEEIEAQRKDRVRCDDLRAEANSLRAQAAETNAAAAKLFGETEGHNKAALAQREDLYLRVKALDHRETQVRDALVDLREREDKAGAAIAKSAAIAQEHERRIQSLAVKESVAEQRERHAAQQSAAAEATLLAAGQWERHAGERESALSARGKELELAMLATENAGREVARELDMARAARASLADTDTALQERDAKLNKTWAAMQSDIASMIRGAGDGFPEVPAEAKVARELQDAAAEVSQFAVQIPPSVGTGSEEALSAFSKQIGGMRAQLARKETAMQSWALSLCKAAAAVAAERGATVKERIAAVDLRSNAELVHLEAASRLEGLTQQTTLLETERRGVERAVKDLDAARGEFQAEKTQAEETRRASKETFAAAEALDRESRSRQRAVEPREEKVSARERSARAKQDKAETVAAKAEALMQDAAAAQTAVEVLRREVQGKAEAVDVTTRAQQEAVATRTAERESERDAELRASRAELKANAKRNERRRDDDADAKRNFSERRRDDDSDDSREYHDAPETVSRSTRRSPRNTSARRTSDLDFREARLREETTRVTAERSALSALRENAIVAADAPGRAWEMNSPTPGTASQAPSPVSAAPSQPTPSPAPSPTPVSTSTIPVSPVVPPPPQNTPSQGSFSFAPPPLSVTQSVESIAPDLSRRYVIDSNRDGTDAVSRAIELDRARAVTDAEATRSRAYAEAEATRARAHAEELERYKAQVSLSHTQAMEAVSSAKQREFAFENERREGERERAKLDERLRERERDVREATDALEAKRAAVEQEAAAAARASVAAADAEARSKELKQAAKTERKKVSDELHQARVEAETSRAWVRRQQEELTRRMRAASVLPRSASSSLLSRGAPYTPGSAGSVGSMSVDDAGSARAAAAARVAGLYGLTGMGGGVGSMTRPPGALADALSPAPFRNGFGATPFLSTSSPRFGNEDSPEAAAAHAVASAVADAAQRAAAQFGSPAH